MDILAFQNVDVKSKIGLWGDFRAILWTKLSMKREINYTRTLNQQQISLGR